MKRDTRIPDEAGMTDRETIINGLEWWVKHQEGEVLPLAYSAVIETLNVLKEYRYAYEKGFNDAMLGKQELMYEGIDGKWHKKDW